MKDITDIDLLPLRSVNHYTYKCENALVKAMEALDKNNIPGAAFQIGRCLGVNAKICEDVRVFLTKLDEAEENRRNYEEAMAAAKMTGDQIIADANRTAEFRSSEIVAEARERAAEIRRQAETDAILERKKAEDEMKHEIANVSAQLTGKLLQREINEEDHRELIDSFLKDLD